MHPRTVRELSLIGCRDGFSEVSHRLLGWYHE